MGQLMTSFRDFETDKGWNWVRAKGPHTNSNVINYLRFEPRGGDTYELFVLDGWPMKASIYLPLDYGVSIIDEGYDQPTRWVVRNKRSVY
jgi:hypothetical protein